MVQRRSRSRAAPPLLAMETKQVGWESAQDIERSGLGRRAITGGYKGGRLQLDYEEAEKEEGELSDKDDGG